MYDELCVMPVKAIVYSSKFIVQNFVSVDQIIFETWQQRATLFLKWKVYVLIKIIKHSKTVFYNLN
jgi:hypothetical protein